VADDLLPRMTSLMNTAGPVAVVGASARPERPSHDVMAFLQEKGRRCIPVNPGQAGGTILGERVYASLSAIPEPVDVVDIFRRPEEVAPIVDEAIEVGARGVWMQLGVVNAEAARRAESAGLIVVMDRCPKQEWGRLGL